MNDSKPGRVFLPKITAEQLVQGHEYSARIIRRIQSKFGEAYVLESDDFQMFLPRHFLKISIPEYMEKRHFSLRGFEKTCNGRQIPLLNFFMA